MTEKEPRPFAKHMRGESRVQPQFQKESDINTVMKQFEKTGMLPSGRTEPPHYGDFTGYSDYHSSMNQIMQAQSAFMELPAAVRLTFDNDPGKFIEFAENPENYQEMVDMGLATSGLEPDTPPTPQPDPNAPTPSPEDPQT